MLPLRVHSHLPTILLSNADMVLIIDGPDASGDIPRGYGRHDRDLHICVHREPIRATAEHQLDRDRLHAFTNKLSVRLLNTKP